MVSQHKSPFGFAGLPVGQLTDELADQPTFINFAMSDEKRKRKFTPKILGSCLNTKIENQSFLYSLKILQTIAICRLHA